ncbi:MAG: M28 family peptidase [Gammaproteobacteria bacterium]|nr:M28 family peptidase [Pseudomonadales bacterium]
MTTSLRQLAVCCVLMLFWLPGQAQDAQWFGLPLPYGLSDPHQPTLIIGDDVGPQPINFDPAMPRREKLQGEQIHTILERIVGFSRQSYQAGDRMWGRIAGYPGFLEVIQWAADEFSDAGIEQVSVDPVDDSQPLWIPLDWSVRLRGPGPDIALESAFPQRGSPTVAGTLEAPVVFVGSGAAADLAGREIAGHIAVVHNKPDPGLYHSRNSLDELVARRPAAIMVVVELPGNMQSIDACVRSVPEPQRIPCFFLGGADGQFLEAALNAVARDGADPLSMAIQLTTESIQSSAANAVAILPGSKVPGEIIVVNAHADGYFEAASDNGDGLAVLVALARHFAQPEFRPRRTLVFVAASGHHTINGARAFVEQHPDLIERTLFILNLEHIAQMNMQTSVSRPATGRAGYRELIADRVEFPQAVGITVHTPLLMQIFRDAARLSGKNINTAFDDFAPGDLGGYRNVGVPMAQLIYASPLYHTSGDVLATVTAPGLERAAHFFEYVIRKVDESSRQDILGIGN